MINQRTAVAMLMYLQRAHGIIPTTGAEMDHIRPLIEAIEQCANGMVSIEVGPSKEQYETQEARRSNGHDMRQ